MPGEGRRDESFERGDAVPNSLFSVEGERDDDLRFAVGVRVVERGDIRHVFPTESIHDVRDVVTGEDLTPHSTVFEGANTVLYFDPPGD